MLKYRQCIISFLIGAWVFLLILKIMIFDEITGLEFAGNATFDNLRVELIDDVGILLFILGVITFVSLVAIGIHTFLWKSKHTKLNHDRD